MPARKTKIGAQKCVTQRHEQRGLRDIARIERTRAEEIAGMVERHDHQHEATQEVDGVEPRPSAGGGGRRIGRAGKAGRERRQPRVGIGQAHGVLFVVLSACRAAMVPGPWRPAARQAVMCITDFAGRTERAKVPPSKQEDRL